jgi:hypothetical protein
MNVLMQGFGQKLALLDKSLKQPITLAETVSEEQIKHGFILLRSRIWIRFMPTLIILKPAGKQKQISLALLN